MHNNFAKPVRGIRLSAFQQQPINTRSLQKLNRQALVVETCFRRLSSDRWEALRQWKSARTSWHKVIVAIFMVMERRSDRGKHFLVTFVGRWKWSVTIVRRWRLEFLNELFSTFFFISFFLKNENSKANQFAFFAKKITALKKVHYINFCYRLRYFVSPWENVQYHGR